MQGSVALVTGAGRGLGAALAAELVACGARVGLVARSREQVERVAALLGAAALPLPADVSCREEVETAVTRVAERFGPPDIVVVNAAVLGPVAPLWETDAADWWRVQQVNLLGAYHTLRAALPQLIARGGGQVLGVSSDAARNTLRNHSGYNVSKAGFEHLHRLAAAETAALGVRVALLDPGGMDTQLMEEVIASDFPDRPRFQQHRAAGRLRPPEVVAAAVAGLLEAGLESGRRYTVEELLSPG